MKSVSTFGNIEEKVYEIDHLERVAPYIKTFTHLEDFG